MKIKDILSIKKKGVSFEFFPPKTDNGMTTLRNNIRSLKKYAPLYVSMTYGAGGSTQERTKQATYLLLEERGLEVMPHLTSVGATKAGIDTLLEDYSMHGISNIMALRGDPPKESMHHDFADQEFSYALDLVKFIKRDDRFCVGVAVYPEGHIETSSLDEDLEYAKMKIDAGADFAVTQMFFDNAYFYRMIERMQAKDIRIPVLPGILPLTDVAKVKQFCCVARTSVPAHIESAMCRYSDPEDMAKAGLDFTIKQCSDLIDHGFTRLHFFTLNKPDITTTVLDAIQRKLL